MTNIVCKNYFLFQVVVDNLLLKFVLSYGSITLYRDPYKRGSAQHSSTKATKESTNMTDSKCRDQLTQYFDLTPSTSNENSDTLIYSFSKS